MCEAGMRVFSVHVIGLLSGQPFYGVGIGCLESEERPRNPTDALES